MRRAPGDAARIRDQLSARTPVRAQMLWPCCLLKIGAAAGIAQEVGGKIPSGFDFRYSNCVCLGVNEAARTERANKGYRWQKVYDW